MKITSLLQTLAGRTRPPRRFTHDGSQQATVYLLADHLDAALAAGEDLLRQRLDVRHPGPATEQAEVLAWHADLRRFLEGVRTYELMLLTRVMRARQRAEEARRSDTRLAAFASLFHTGTNALADAIADTIDPRRIDFDQGAEAITFLKTRAVLARECDGLDTYSSLEITERTLVAGAIELGVLLDHVATFLDVLEAHYNLFADDDAASDTEATVSAA